MEKAQSLTQEKTTIGDLGLDELQSTFVRNVQHELRTPLTIIQGYVELLHSGEMGNLAPEQQQAMLLIVDRVLHLRTLVERVTTLMAIEAQAITSLPFSLDEMVEIVIKARKEELEQSQLALDLDSEPNLPLIFGDPYQIQQGIDCLVENAIKFTPAGGQIQISLKFQQDWIYLTVADTGVGMSADEADRALSMPFYQIDGSTTRHYGGLGLGLTLAQAVAKAHHGELEIESNPGLGSRIVMRLPILDTKSLIDQEKETSTDMVARRVLVVDDEEIVALTIQEGLEKLPNCRVEVATNGEEALRKFQEQPYDLLITDYKMPGTDGMTLAARVRQLFPKTVIVMVTAYGDHALREQAARASIRHILDKPVGLDEIRKVTLEAFDQPEKDGE